MNEEKKQSNKLWLALGLGCGIPLGLIVLLFFGAIAYFATGPEGGVRLTNNMEDYALEYIEEHELLADGEKVIAYYDVTVGLSGSEAAILTDSRLIYHKNGRNSEMPLANVDTVETDGDGMGGDVIRVVSKDGDTMVIEIAVFNQGELFIKALEDKVAAIQDQPQPAQ